MTVIENKYSKILCPLLKDIVLQYDYSAKVYCVSQNISFFYQHPIQ
jgi:hypothetical protein